MKCDKYGSKMECDESKILTSYPQETKGYLQGWVCPKCGSVMSPYQSVCPHCQPPQKLEIWC